MCIYIYTEIYVSFVVKGVMWRLRLRQMHGRLQRLALKSHWIDIYIYIYGVLFFG